MRILHFIDALNYGGAETLLMGYIPLLTEHQHVVVVLNGPNVFARANYEYIEFNYRPVKNFIQVRNALARIIRGKKIDIVHSHSYWTNIISRFATPRNIPLFNHYHFADYDSMKNKTAVKRMILIDRLVKHKNLVRVAVSKYVADILYKTFPGSIVEVISNFVTCMPGKIIPKKPVSDELRIVAVGNCNREKNYDYLIRVFSALKNERVSVDIMGGGTLLEYYRNEVKRCGLSRVKFCGIERNAREKLENYDVFLSTSVSETFGLAVLEAVCAGLSLMVSDIPAYREVAPVTSCFFDPYNEQDLVNKIIDFSRNRSMSNESDYKETLRKYSAENFLAKLRALYANTADSKPR